MAYLEKMAEMAINRQIVNKSSNENLASNLNICRILDIASPLAIFRCLCQIFNFCQILPFLLLPQGARGPFLESPDN